MSTENSQRLAPENEQRVVKLIDDADKLLVISALKRFLASCLGPGGKTKYVKNRHGALMALTASSQRLLSNMTFVSPISQIISTSILQHLSAYSDGGLLMGVFMLSLIEGAMSGQIHHMICCDVNTILMKRCMEIADSAVIKIDLSEMRAMLCLVRSVFQSKRSCSLLSQEIDILSSLVLQILTSALPDHEYSSKMTIPTVAYVLIPGRAVSEARLVDGVLLDVPRSLLKSISAWKDRFAGRRLKVALFNTSLDIDKVLIEGVTLEADSDLDLEEYYHQQLVGLASRLQQAGVDAVGCQKVIHPTLVKMLEGRGMLSLERLSIVHIESVQKLTGACLLSSVNSTISADSLGYLDGIDLYEGFNNLRRLHLKNGNQVTTVILCHRVEACLDELKHIFGVASHVASLAIGSPGVVLGRGCFEALMAAKIQEELPSISEDACARIHCSTIQFNQAAEVFLQALRGIASSLGQSPADSESSSVMSTASPTVITDSSQKPDPARNGMSGIEGGRSEDVQPRSLEDSGGLDWATGVVDLWEIKQNAMKMAVEVANLILSVGSIMGPPE